MDYLDNPMVADEFVSYLTPVEPNECCMCGDDLDSEEMYKDKEGYFCKHCLLDKYLVAD